MLRAARLAALPLMLLAAACAADAPPGPARPEDGAALAERAAVLGSFMRAALVCGLPVSATAQDRAAAIETAALDMHQRRGGTPARDAFLKALQPPRFDPRRAGRDRAAWCAERRPDVARVAAWLDSAEGKEFAERAEAAQR